MKIPATLLLLLLILACSPTVTAQLQLALPRAEWLLESSSPPQLQKEGLFSPPEQPFVGRLMPMINQGRWEEALVLYEEFYPEETRLITEGTVLANTPDQSFPVSAAAAYMLGHVFMSLDNMPASEAAFLTALETVPDYIRVHESLGLMYLSTERMEEAREHLVRAAELGLNTANLFGSLGYLNQEENNYWGAVSAYQDAMMLDPDSGQWQQGLLYSLVQTAQYDSAMTLINQLLQQRPSEGDVWLFRAQVASNLGRENEALASLETAIRLGNSEAANLQVAASLHMQVGSVPRAVTLLQRAVDEGMGFSFYDQALNWLVINEEWNAAQELLTSAPAAEQLTQQELSRIQTHRASIAQNDGNTADARTLLEEAIELDASNALALISLADIYRNASNYNQADLLYQRASTDSLYRENALVSMAQLSVDQTNYRRALTLLQEVIDENPGRTDLRANIDILQNLVLAADQN